MEVAVFQRMERYKKSEYSPAFQQHAIRMVVEARDQHDSQWADIESIAAKIGCTTEARRRWVRQHECDTGQRQGLTTAETRRIKELERELRRKDKALAETAALLVLSKKLEAIFQRDKDEDE